MLSENRRRFPKKTVFMIIIAVLALFVFTLSAVVIVLAGKIALIEKDNESLAAYASAVPEYRYPESTDVVTIDDAYLGEISIPALENVPRASYDYDRLSLDDGRYVYETDGRVTSAAGIDVSYFNEDIDWEAVKADGIDFAMIRVGYRGYKNGDLNLDPKFHEYMTGAIAAGLDVGVYFYTQAIDTDEALAEAEFVIKHIAPYEITYPVTLDIEITSAEDVRANDVSGQMLTDIAEVFCERIKEAGYRPMIYANKRMAYLKLDMRRICKYDFWYAEFDNSEPPTFAYDFQVWQYATDGDVDGINGNVDMNISFRHFADAAIE
jgi:GH25 family lysozyme M1 (1,4-beta-N-acetylmuramidase)